DTLIPVATEIAVVAQPVSSSIEPNSTKPIPAKRDVPLPEALPEPIEELLTAGTMTVDKKITTEKANNVKVVTTDIISNIIKNNPQVIVDKAQLAEVEETLHLVMPGENLYNISVKYNIKLKTLRQWNNIAKKNKIRIGDELYVVDPQTVKNINE
ncbi:MAG: type IV pilus assembly protein PilF, partial [Colwellia sp.]